MDFEMTRYRKYWQCRGGGLASTDKSREGAYKKWLALCTRMEAKVPVNNRATSLGNIAYSTKPGSK